MADTFDRQQHWEKIYTTKEPTEVSWFQEKPLTSIALIEKYGDGHEKVVVDIGGGDGYLVDYLLEEGYANITVLDVSAAALDKAKERLQEKADKINWVESDITAFQPDKTYDLWHDRAVFHFLTIQEEVSRYVDTARNHIRPGGILILGTFSTDGPLKCSGIEIQQYSIASMTALFSPYFEKLECFTEDHQTPFGTSQNFLFCVFRRRDA